VYVQCAMEAMVPIKCYSPELMVEGVYDGAAFDLAVGIGDEEQEEDETTAQQRQHPLKSGDQLAIRSMVEKVTNLMDRMHVLVIGPGLGRCPMVMKAVADIVIEAKERRLPLVLDADALYMLSLKENRNLLVDVDGDVDLEDAKTKPPRSVIILTPNIVEYKRLVDSIGEGSEEKLNQILEGVVIVKKGSVDEIECYSNSTTHKMICAEEGGLKRSGGIGDILAGTIGTFVAWNRILAVTSKNSNESSEKRINDLVLACWMGCCVTKRATRLAFIKKKRSMTAPDILEEIGPVIDDIASTTINY